MSIGITNSEIYTAIASAIRSKNKTESTYKPGDMAAAIMSIPTDLVYGVIRPDAELIASYSSDRWAVADVSASIATYSTAVQTILATSNLTPKVTIDLDNYDYFVVERSCAIPTYTEDLEKQKGYNEFSISSLLYEITRTPANMWKTLDGTKTYTSINNTVYSAGAHIKVLYWSSATAISIYSGTYGIFNASSAPGLASTTTNSTTLTLKTPILQMRGHTTYLTSTVFNAVTDIRQQYVIDVYRSSRNNLNIDGWGGTQQINKILTDINTNQNHKIT